MGADYSFEVKNIEIWVPAFFKHSNSFVATVYSAFTFFYDHDEGEWINGPSLMQARRDHAAGIVTDEVTDENFVAVTGGYDGGNSDSTEILQDGEWVQGKTYVIFYNFSGPINQI